MRFGTAHWVDSNVALGKHQHHDGLIIHQPSAADSRRRPLARRHLLQLLQALNLAPPQQWKVLE